MKASAGLLLLSALLASLGCSDSEEKPPADMGGSGGAAGGGGGTTPGGSGGTPGSGGSAGAVTLTHVFGSIGSGGVGCPNANPTQCASGMACCNQVPFKDDSCVSSFDACPCGPLWDRCSVSGCDEPADCPGAKCCATYNKNRSSLHEFAGSSCKPSCDATADAIVCSADTDCGPGEHCMQSSENYKRCF